VKIAYELRRLRSRGAIKKIKNTHNYQLAEEGYEWMYCMIFSSSYFVSPLLSKYCKRAVEQDVENPSTIEEAYSQIIKGSTPDYIGAEAGCITIKKREKNSRFLKS
jgi:hypothetical protein